MKFIHCADLHLNAKMSAFLTEEQAEERRAELLCGFQRMVQYAEEHQVRKILISGDLYDSSSVSATAANVIADTISGHPEIDFFYLKGNHDSGAVIRSFRKIPDNLKLFGERWVRYTLTDQRNPELASITITGRELSEKDCGEGFTCPAFAPDRINLVMLHGQLNEYESDCPWSIPLEKLKDKNIDYLALGHVHKPQQGTLDRRGSWAYPGCLEGRGFDECGEHGFILLDIDRKNRTIRKEFVPFALRKLYTIYLDAGELHTTGEVCQAAEVRFRKENVSEADMVCLVLEGKVGMDFELNMVLLKKQLAAMCYVLKVKDQTEIRPDDDSYALQRSLKGEFVRLVKARDDLDDRMKTEIIRCGIDRLMGNL